MTTSAAGAMEIKNEFCESRGTDPRITDEPFQLSAQVRLQSFQEEER